MRQYIHPQDDCWGVRNQTSGEIMGDPERFPEGMPSFITKIHELGFKFGLYTDIGVNGCHHPFVGSWPDYQRDADTFAKWEVRTCIDRHPGTLFFHKICV